MTTSTLVVIAIAVVVAGSLVVLTGLLHRATATAVDSVESVRLTQEAQIGLLLHERAIDPIVRSDLAGDVLRRLDSAQRFITTADEEQIHGEAETRVTAYLAVARDPARADELVPSQGAAYGALQTLTNMNVVQAQVAGRDAARLNEVGNVLGVTAGLVLAVVGGALLVWLAGRAFEPILELAAMMERFGSGDHDARAPQRGPRELREMCRRFNEMASSIAAQREAQLAFLGGVAHDLRDPLSAVQMSVALLRHDQSVAADEGVRQAVERIGRQVQRMDRMVGDFLDGARIEAGLLELRLELHDARAIVEQAVDLFEGLAHAHALQVRLPVGAVPICCDHLRIEQVISNLVSNAIKYSSPGSTVEVVLDSSPSELELRVHDTGVGISEAELAGLFDPFRRGGLAAAAAPGSGLGLFVVRRIVEAHGGRIEVESAAGEGSTFRVLLPRGDEGCRMAKP
jgi:two-component system, OmpR family, sensor histidine kinase MtrB